jgi:methionyl-tRNA formyltransferase
MKIVVICPDEPIAKAVVSHLMNNHQVFLVLEESSFFTSLLRPLKRKSHPYWSRFSRVISLLVFGLFYKLFVFPVLVKQFTKRILVHKRISPKEVNSKETLQFVSDLNADLVLTIGSSLLSTRWLDLGCPVINLHTGKLPFYRGRFCWFWPIFEDKWNDIGISVHQVQSRADSGLVIAYAPIEDLKPRECTWSTYFQKLALGHIEAISSALTSPNLEKKTSQEDTSYSSYFEPHISELLKTIPKMKIWTF